MGVEIERKFLVISDAWRARVRRSEPMRQMYLASHEGCSIRVRIAGESASLNIKGRTLGARRLEYAYPLPMEDALSMWSGLGGPGIEKVRHFLEVGGHTWEIDEFGGANEGLVVAEVELSAEDEAFVRPDWVGDEVTGDFRYYNVCLAERPWPGWRHEAG
jgi:adenylate cyclase